MYIIVSCKVWIKIVISVSRTSFFTALLQVAAPAVFVDKNTKVICQGLTGKNGTFHTEQVGLG